MTQITLAKTWKALALATLGFLALAPEAVSADVRAEAVLSEQRPYVQQGSLYTLRIYSDRSLKSVEVALPAVNGGLLSKLDEEWTARNAPGSSSQGGVITERRYLFTPMRAGRVEIPPASLDVTLEAAPAGYSQKGTQPYGYPGYVYPGYGQPYQQQNAAPKNQGPKNQQVRTAGVTVEVASLPAQAASLQPLHGLRLDSRFQTRGEPKLGEPVTLEIAVTAIGATGDRLPSVADRLQTSEFKVYADRPKTEWQFDERLQQVVGRRLETVTLIPTRTGPVELPIVEIPWWNVISGHAETARLTTPPLRIGDSGSAAVPTRTSSAASESALNAGGVPLHTEREDIWGFWLPVGGGLLLAFFIGWRTGVAQKRRRAQQEGLTHEATPSPWSALAPAAARTRSVVSKVVPRSLIERARRGGSNDSEPRELPAFLRGLLQGVNAIMPRRVKIWTCMRCVQRAPEPGPICGVLRRFARECLGMPENASLQSIGNAVASQRPSAETSAYMNLFGRLDDAAYGAGEAGFDLDAWKKDFKRLFGRLLRRSKRWSRDGRGDGLPALNPR